MASIVVGSISVPLCKAPVQEDVRTIWYDEEKVVFVPEVRSQSYTIGCSSTCPALDGYTKSSMRRASKEGTLTPYGSCPRCGMFAQIGGARSHIQTVNVTVNVEKVVVERKCRYEVVAKQCVQPTMTAPKHIMAPLPEKRKEGNQIKAEVKVAAEDVPLMRKRDEETHPKTTTVELPKHTFRHSVHIEKEAPSALEILSAYFQNDETMKRRMLIQKHRPVYQKKNGTLALEHLSEQLALIKQQKLDDEEKANKEFMEGKFSNTVHVGEVHGLREKKDGESVGMRSEWYKRTQKTVKVPKKIHVEKSVERATNEIVRLCARKRIPLEFIGRRRRWNIQAKFVLRRRNLLPKIHLLHEEGRFLHQEVTNPQIDSILDTLCKHARYRGIKDADIKRGDSGLVFDDRAQITLENTRRRHFIVRGRQKGRLLNALEPVEDLYGIEHYSQSPEQHFFNGWKRVFDKMVPNTEQHEHLIDFNNEQCGELAAIICQTLYPVHKLSCKRCRQHISGLSWEDYKQFVLAHFGCCEQVYNEHGQFEGFEMVQRLVKQATSENNNIETAMQIVQLVQNYTNTHMLQIKDINHALMKGSSVTQFELKKALEQLLEMARWWKNHMSLSGEDALKAFRNKRSSKALINPNLLCDNQLDKNGNFVWGERGYHAKRFFSNFFDEVLPSEGYAKYVERVHPNGKRELAIGSLIVPLDLHKIRLTLQGKSIKREPLTQACVSQQDGNFIYPCCCVTQDDGKPLYSEFKSPTKRHLVVGTSGDPKYVDLPTNETERMYIAKEGYCYLNIFLAMLVNVNENEAKDFTKMVRDVVVPRLGKWPTMMDVATTAHLLASFHPDTRNAELPRILVDHATQTMHVIDSFGSLTVGYHVLKAGTVNQLIQFASNDLSGEMKHYRVGGEPQRMRCERALISSVFKPKRMRWIIENDPYILMMGLVSPSVLIHMFRMRHFEKGVELWINKNQSVAKIFLILEQLTRKISRNDLLIEQLNTIQDTAGHLKDTLALCPSTVHSYKPASDLLTLYIEKCATNKQLRNNGFSELNNDLYIALEKTYIDQLKQEWRALSWLEKSSVTWHLKKFTPSTEEFLTKKVSREKNASLKEFVSACFVTTQTHLQNSRTMFYNRCYSIWRAITTKAINIVLSVLYRCYSDIIYLVNVCLIFSLLVQMAGVLRNLILEARRDKLYVQTCKRAEAENTVVHLYDISTKANGGVPTKEDFMHMVGKLRPDLLSTVEYMIADHESATLQGKTSIQLQFEKIIAFMALVTMVIDNERSDAIFRILSKLRTVFATIGEDVQVQSLDDILNIEDDKKLTIDFDLATATDPTSTTFDVKFEEWWNRQLQQNRVVPHYRCTGEFLEFTRETAAKVANQIVTSHAHEFLIRGAVGSGKSTGLPHHLSKKGKVLLLEPTRPLAENVSTQLAKDPFYQNVTLRMRGLSKFGSSNITVMTSGFAFHYYVNNPQQLMDFDFIIIDECHVLDSSTIAFNCALKEFEYAGKLLKVSATPPGRECEFVTQHPVKVKIEEHLSFQNFVQAQATGSNADMVQHGHNILVYVASYNEVDQLARLLNDRNYKVTKVDGRTMQMGNVEITTTGTEGKPHFVVATNIIENGVTLDVDCVVDFGLKVVATLDADSRCVVYSKKAVTYGERIQRLGRVGRVKPGFALRIGHTEKGIEEIPEYIATEAAFLSFAYSLPITTQSVSTSLLSRCTVKQARTALNFEITPFFTTHYIKYDGSMHPEIHKCLKSFKLRESEMILNKLAIPYQYTSQWMSVREYERLGVRINCSSTTRLPFFVHGIPDNVFESLWECVCKYKSDAGFGRITSVNATKVSYTLSTDPTAIPRTVAIIDQLIGEERMKKNHFDTIGSAVTGGSFSLTGIANSLRNRYLRDHTQHNINILQHAKAQLLEFDCTKVDFSNLHTLEGLGVINTVCLQSKAAISEFIGLKGKWDGRKFLNDIVLATLSLIGGGWMLWEYITTVMKEPVFTQGKKRMLQKLKFRDARDRKVGREVYADDYTMEHTFGEAYTKKGKQKGSTHTKGMGKKLKNFVHMYGVEPENYSMIRFVDPLTGHTMDESTRVDIRIVQDEFGEIRNKLVEDDVLEKDRVYYNPGIQAYFLGKGSEEAVRVDLTPHRPTLLCRNSNAIAGFPEREDELRQTGPPVTVPMAQVPQPNEVVTLECKSVYKGLRDYNSISTLVCQLVNASDGRTETIFGIGYGSYIITNGHLFRRNNGQLTVKTWHGEFIIHNTTQIKIHFIEGKDAIIIRMPKDFPPFGKRNLYRAPKKEERVCMVGTNFQEKSMRSTVSESSIVFPEGKGSFWVHWITTQDGYCGLPLVSVEDGKIVGFHGLTSNVSDKNFFVPFIDDFEEKYLKNAESLEWSKHWFWQPDKIAWGSLNLVTEQPKENFKISKLVTDLFAPSVATQSKVNGWVLSEAIGNIAAVGQANSALVTKHVVKGRCPYFTQYLATNSEAEAFFRPLMNQYQPSKLNKQAFNKDFFKYSKPVVLNEVDDEAFKSAVKGVEAMMREIGFKECVYITDPDSIYDSLNLKAAVGAQYVGKKSDYLKDMDDKARERLLYHSCERLFYGYKGVWNGSLKAELRPIEKVQANKTRTFTAAPIDTLLGAKVCVDDFNNQFYSLNLEGPWTVGMTKFYGGWDELMRKLPDGWLYCHADGSQFDSSLTPLLLNAVLGLRMSFMEDWWVGHEMLANLYAEIVYTPILTPDGTIFKKFRGNNSGQPSTVVDNTLMVIIAMYYSCFKYHWNVADIRNRLVFFANGDDVILAVQHCDEDLLDHLSASFAELGLNYNFDERTTKREELWFMSHRAIQIDGIYIPKLEQERVVSILEWDRSKELMHRTEAICAAMIEAWGYPDLLREIRKFYLWLLSKDEFKEIAKMGKAPYISECALNKLYTNREPKEEELWRYINSFSQDYELDCCEEVVIQSSSGGPEFVDAGEDPKNKRKGKESKESVTPMPEQERDKDVGQSVNWRAVPRLKKITKRMSLPTVKGNVILDLDHLLEYKPSQTDLFNTRATKAQFEAWYEAVKNEYDLTDAQMQVVMNGFMVWCIDNGTSPNVNGVWVMMDGDEQVEYPLKPMVENAKPTLRQIMHHFSDAAEAYIEMRNSEGSYMPRYGLLRNLRDKSLARYAFDFYEVNSKTSDRAREAVAQMKAAALVGIDNKLFGLDGNIATNSENTERHTARDVNQNMHTLLGMGSMQ